ncbi:MAG: 4-hydroxy-tetrahydrodipicolinate synthase, partial [Pseudomonadota bacterium]
LITPMKQDGSVDEKSFQNFVEWQIKQGSHGLVPTGTTGESATLSHQEHIRVIKLCVEACNHHVPVIAGVGSNSTDETISLAQGAQKAGVDALLIVTPYYNKPSQDGLYLHYKTIAQSIDFPIIIYNIPGRCIIDMSVETMQKIVKEYPHIIGVKDATAKLERPLETRLALGQNFIQLSGEDASVTAFLAQGGCGCISVTANVAPKLSSQLHHAWKNNDYDRCFQLRDRLMALHKAMFCEPSPAPAKYALSLLQDIDPFCRLPIAPLSQSAQKTVQKAMRDAGIL